MSKLRVVVLRGGPSPEYEVSLKTGANILQHLPERYQPVDVLIDRNGDWHTGGLPLSPYNIGARADVVFNALHGTYGEDGQVQNVLDQIKVPYTGSGSLASALGMNKVEAKRLFAAEGLKTPRHILISKDDDLAEKLHDIFSKISPPWIVKPRAGGSSIGTNLVRLFDQLSSAVEEALLYSDQAMVEEFVRGQEATCGVLEEFRGRRVYPLLPIEIRKPTSSSFFNYAAKYGGETEEICPGNFSDEEKRQIEEAAALVHRALGLRHYSRSDFIISPRGLYILEVNTLPGLTEQSLLPKSLAALGVNYPDFLDHVIGLAISR